MPALLGTVAESPPPPQADKAAASTRLVIFAQGCRRFGWVRFANVCLRQRWVANHRAAAVLAAPRGSGIGSNPL